MNGILLYSGGLDSLMCYYWLTEKSLTRFSNNLDTLYVNLNHRYARKELKAISSLPITPTHTLHSDYGYYFEKGDAHIPGRNLLLSMFAAGLDYSIIWLVAQKGEQNIPDRSPEFFQQTSEQLSFHFERPISLKNPFLDVYKSQMVKWFLKSHPAEWLIKSISCYSEEEGHCGQCTSCFRKYVSLTINKVDCENIFNRNVKEWGKQNYLPHIDTYDQFRKKEILEVLT